MTEQKKLTRSELEVIIKRRAAITISFFAALLAINTLIAGANSSKILNATLQSQNLWAWYQAKNVRVSINSAMADLAEGDKTASSIALAQHYRSEVQRLRSEPNDGMEALAAKARAIEADRDNAKQRSPYFTYATSLLQIGIVLSTAAILAVVMPMFWLSAVIGLAGAASFFVGWLG